MLVNSTHTYTYTYVTKYYQILLIFMTKNGVIVRRLEVKNSIPCGIKLALASKLYTVKLGSLCRDIFNTFMLYLNIFPDTISTQKAIDHLGSQLARLQSRVNQLPTQNDIGQIRTDQSAMRSTVANQQVLATNRSRTMQSVCIH